MWSIRLTQRAAITAPPLSTTTMRTLVGGRDGLHHRRGVVASVSAVVQS